MYLLCCCHLFWWTCFVKRCCRVGLYSFSLVFLYWYVCFACLAMTNLTFRGPCIVIYSYSNCKIVHLVGFYYKNISRYTVLWMSNWRISLIWSEKIYYIYLLHSLFSQIQECLAKYKNVPLLCCYSTEITRGKILYITNLLEITNKMRPCSRIYYSNVS